MARSFTRAAFLTAPALFLSLFLTQPVLAASVEPEIVAGNPTCVGLGYDFGFKVDPPSPGTYTVFGSESVTVATDDGVHFDWSSTFGMDAVIAKGGQQGANLYVYDPPAESFGDTDLVCPDNPGGDPAAISHIEFCYDFEVEVSKTAQTSFTRTFSWTIDKSVSPDTWDLFTGDSGTSLYTVAVTRTGYTDSAWAVQGTIEVYNPAPVDATIASVTDALSDYGAVAVDCGVTFPYTLAPGGTLSCTYASTLPNGASRTNTATVATSGAVGGGSDDADVVFGTPTTVVNGSINVSDTNGGSWSFSDSGFVTYSATFDCDDDEGTHDNTATITETGQSDDASVTVSCYELSVTKDAAGAYTRTWTWNIDKSADQTDLLLSEGQLFQVNYQVATSTSSVDSGHGVTGNIAVNNPAPVAATLNGVADVVSPAIVASVDCGGASFPYALAAGGTLNCTYSAALPDAALRTNTATATLQNYAYDSAGGSIAGGTTNFSHTVNVSLLLTSEIDECIDVSDTNVGVLGTVCSADAPKNYNYALFFGNHPDADVYLECGENSHTNIASFVTNDTATTGSGNWTVLANVACEQGCTLTPGYWKTHSFLGPAPCDDNWASLCDPVPGDYCENGAASCAENTSFFGGASYLEVLNTPPAGNVYYILSFAYIACELNQLNGASIPADVLAAFDEATALFEDYTPAQAAALKGGAKKVWTDLATILDDYNNGLTGPGHCDE